ncbi:MAG: PaaI family thioesterase [Acidobacteriaceae bacterium]|nr:PaaI family thioesterase [Acidobacteriaceae bacterium]MBV8484343.1 PaaI family thioesterase [Verrucomicrobiota bacterium]
MHKPDLSESPYQRFLGLELVHHEEGLVEIRMPFREEFLRDDGSDWLHGGILSALIDIAGDYAVYSKTGGDVPTVDLRVDYLRPAKRGCLTAIARTVKVGRRVSIADVDVKDEQGQVVAVGRGVYATPAP